MGKLRDGAAMTGCVVGCSCTSGRCAIIALNSSLLYSEKGIIYWRSCGCKRRSGKASMI